MKLLFVCLSSCLFVSVLSWGKGDLEKYGPFQLLLHSNVIKCDHNRNLNLDVSEIDVYIYDYSINDTRKFRIGEAAKGILALDFIDKARKFVFFVGGYNSHILKNTQQAIRQTFRNHPNMYLIIFDHYPYTNDKIGKFKSYERAVKYVHYIGVAIAQFLADLQKGFIPAKNMHCIGHSLGSQILGQVGEVFYTKTGQKIARITALDPAGPCFSNSLVQEQVRAGVADYVEVYHCNAGSLGTTSVLGDIDFFINKRGQSQPNCGTPLLPGIFDSTKAARCSHNACVQIYEATVNNPSWFLAHKCDNYKKYKEGKCSNAETTIAGFWNPGNATGIYYFSTEGYDI